MSVRGRHSCVDEGMVNWNGVSTKSNVLGPNEDHMQDVTVQKISISKAENQHQHLKIGYIYPPAASEGLIGPTIW